jgi:hypothetical protein
VSTIEQVRDEEREARQAQRERDREERDRDRRRDKQAQSVLGAIIREELARERAKQCKCGITPSWTRQQLRDFGSGCTSGLWVCPVLDAIRRRMDK